VVQVARPPAAGPVGDADPEVPADWEPPLPPDGELLGPLPLVVVEWQAVASVVTVAARTIVRLSGRLVRIDTRSPDCLEMVTECNHGVFADIVPADARENSSYGRHS
jgi:hypothetical protein